MPQLQPVDASYATAAPRTVVVEQSITASPSAIWDIITDNPGWVRWFPTMTRSENTSDPAGGIGSTRTVKVGPLRAEERFVAWEANQRWGFTITKTNLPMAKRFLEQLQLIADGDRTTVRYTGAYEPHTLTRPIAALIDRQIRTAWTNGLAGLAAHVAAQAAGSSDSA